MLDPIQSKTIVIRQTWYWYECFHCGQASPREESPELARYMAQETGVFNARGFWFCDHCSDFIPEKTPPGRHQAGKPQAGTPAKGTHE